MTLAARSPARFLRFSVGISVSDHDELSVRILLQFQCNIVELSLASVVHAPRLLGVGYSHSFSFVAFGGGGGGGFSIVTVLDVEAVSPRESVQVALIVIGTRRSAGCAQGSGVSAAGDAAAGRGPSAHRDRNVVRTGAGASDSDMPPACNDVGLAEQDMVGGFFGGSVTAKFAVQLAVLFFFALGSVMVAVTV